MAFLSGKDKEYVEDIFKKLKQKVNILFFTTEIDCEYCPETHKLLKELVEVGHDNINLEVYNMITDKEKAEEYKIDKSPAIVIMGEKDYGIRYYGIPAGYEFSSILEDIQMVAKGQTTLSDKTREELKKIDKPLKLQVFVTPTCPYCPKAVIMAHQLAMESEYITAEMVEATEFPELSSKYNVRGVPRTVIGEDHFVEGAVPENMFVNAVLEGFAKLN